MNKTWMKITAIVLCILMTGGLVYAAVDNSGSTTTETTDNQVVTDGLDITENTGNSTVEESTRNDPGEGMVKDETVYVLTSGDGSVKKLIVSDWIKNGLNEKELSDVSELQNITNVKGEETYTLGGDKNCVWNADGNDIYYRGDISKELPVDMKVRYTLDGKTVSPEELAGKCGKVTIRFEYENKQYEIVEIDGKEEKIYVPFVMLTGMILENEHFTNINVTNGKLVNDGDRTIVAGYALPGMQENLGLSEDVITIPDYVEITADVKDFSLGITVTIATNELFNKLDSHEMDFSKLDELKAELSENGEIGSAVNQILDGSDALYEGLGTLLEKANELVSGVEKLAEGAEQLKSGSAALSAGASELAAGAKELSCGLDTLAANNATLNGGAKTVFETLLSTAETQIKASGIDCPKLTIDNYGKVLDSVIASLDKDKVYTQAQQLVKKKVEENRAYIESEVTKAVRAQVTAAVIQKATGMDAATYEGAVAAGMVDANTAALISSAIDQQMATNEVKATIQSNTEAQIQKLIADNMESAEVKAKLTAASEGVKTLAALKKSLNDYNAFYVGLNQYTAGVASAAQGAKTLSAGANTLSEGASQLSAGANDLYNGILTLKDGLPALITGVTELKEGAGSVSDGLHEFYEKISVVMENYEGSFNTLATRIQAMQDVSHAYQNFSGIGEGMDGSVRFIYRTEEVK